ncbi:GFA family protein [Lutibaculum baratangense]|uniref:Glutathione-dependent formaldehyde-activating, GFA n=1 Tax=Lutibaculum baratangense AMV1 TaxID=631454 RepID=V4R344_9HYPH|nr:GFA family protein [Lutibaculum baratangense]ESR26367.1 glutathione-dependent formaldehyde-activating, GFA [Lutibaculum baratangense AMV1]
MTTLPLTGGCLCGAVRYEVTAEPQSSATCHCRMCQRQSGSAFMGFFTVPRSGLRMTGEVREHASSGFATRGFCPVCGSSLTMAYAHEPDAVGLTMGTLDDPSSVPPALHWGVESWVVWLRITDDLPRQRTDEDPEFLEAKRRAEERDAR